MDFQNFAFTFASYNYKKMGLVTEKTKKTYLQIRDGKVAKWNGTENELFHSVIGQIVGISTRDHTYGTDLCIDLKDDKETFQLQIRIKGADADSKQTSYFIAFAHCAPAIDVSKPVEFTPFLKVENDKKKSALFLRQGLENLKWAYKVGDEGIPKPEEVFNKKGELVATDWSEVEIFRMNKVNELAQRANEYSKAINFDIPSEKIVDEVFDEQSADDLPF